MPRGASQKREREYNELKRKFERSGRYQGREDEVAARIVNKQRARFGETKESKRKDRQGESPDPGLPLPNYQQLTVQQVAKKLKGKSTAEIERLLRYEKSHKKRKTLIPRLEHALEHASG